VHRFVSFVWGFYFGDRMMLIRQGHREDGSANLGVLHF
jgi:hypothetical protein